MDATQTTTPTESRRCTKCGRVKPAAAFTPLKRRSGYHSWCRNCVRIGAHDYRLTEAARARREGYAVARKRERETDHRREALRERQKEYRSRPEVRERRRETDRLRREARRARQRAYRRTPRGKVLHARSSTLSRLRRALDAGDGRRAERLGALVAAYERELARMDAAPAGRRARSA